MSKYQNELQIASDVVTKTSEISEWFRETGFRIIEKQDHSPVTLADYAGQIYINHHLKKHFPKDQIIAEEHIKDLTDRQERIIRTCFQDLNIPIKKFESSLNYRGTTSRRQWTVDPIDGTKGFIANLSYSIGIGFMVNTEPIVSAIASPNFDERGLGIFRAELGQGAEASYNKKKFQSIHVSNELDLSKAKVCISLHNVSEKTLKFLKKHNIRKSSQLQMDGMGKFCKVADGTADYYFHLNRSKMFVWDYCPGDLLVREAGGKSTDIKNNRLKFRDNLCVISAPGYVFCNNAIHKKLLTLF
jgi:3'(2'), 5'-bisphosphate nucleotidase